ncbi:MAG: DUF3011 domain-containing protein [Sphingomonadaceae bacterium]
MTSQFALALVAAVGMAGPLAAQVRPTPLPAPSNPIARPQPTPLPAPIPPVATPLPAPVPSQRYFAGTVRCESQNHRTRSCRARTQNRVEIVQVHGGSCVRGRSFTYDEWSITVRDGCRATFAYGYGNVRPKASSGGNALPWVLAGAGATAGIVALANSGSSSPEPEARPAPPPPPPPPPPAQTAPPPPPDMQGPPFPALPPARIDANIQFLTPDQQRSMQTCLFEGARQTGLTGGSVFRFDAMDQIEQGSGGWRFRFRATGTWPNGERQGSIFCRATPTQIVEFTVTPLGPGAGRKLTARTAIADGRHD